MRRLFPIAAVFLAALSSAGRARAQEPPTSQEVPVFQAGSGAAEAAEPDRVSVTAFFFVGNETTAPAAVALTAALRRGLLENDALEFKDPTDAMSTAESRDAADAALALLQEARNLVEQGSYADAQPHLVEALRRFESNLAIIKKRDLTDALMLLGVVQCGLRRRAECVETFVRVLTFREGMPFDAQRYPALAATAFEEAARRVDDVPRGSVEFRTEPAGAEVFIDGRSRGAAPLVVEGLRVGDHYVTIKLPGYDKHATRFTVAPDFQQTYDYQLERSDQYVVLQQSLRGVPPEIGQERAGSAIRELRGVLFVDQVVLGTIRDRGGQLEIDVCLYDLRTGLRLKELRRTGRVNQPTTLAGLGHDLYEGVDMRGFVEAPPPPRPPTQPTSRSIFTRWWFWGIVGVVITGTVVTALAFPEPEIPDGTTQVTFRVQTPSRE